MAKKEKPLPGPELVKTWKSSEGKLAATFVGLKFPNLEGPVIEVIDDFLTLEKKVQAREKTCSAISDTNQRAILDAKLKLFFDMIDTITKAGVDPMKIYRAQVAINKQREIFENKKGMLENMLLSQEGAVLAEECKFIYRSLD